MLVKFTWRADANLDGIVNLSDLTILAGNYSKTSGVSWANADFNGDGTVNLSDLTILAANYNKGTAPGSALLSFQDSLAMFPQLAGTGEAGSVPEPMSLGVLGLGGLGLMVRRSRR